MRIQGLILFVMINSGILAHAEDTPATCPANDPKLTEINFEAKKVLKHDARAEKRSDGWHLNDLEGGDIYVNSDGKVCVKADSQVKCGDQIGKDTASDDSKLSRCPTGQNQDTRDNKSVKRIHGTCLLYSGDMLKIFPLNDDGSVDMKAPYITVGGDHSKEDHDSHLTVEIVNRDTPSNSGHLNLTAAKVADQPSDSDNPDLGTKCAAGGLDNATIEVTDKGAFTKTGSNSQNIASTNPPDAAK